MTTDLFVLWIWFLSGLGLGVAAGVLFVIITLLLIGRGPEARAPARERQVTIDNHPSRNLV